jgi:hypothetical protein
MKLDNAWYHLILFISCLVFLAAIILTGHDSSPLVKDLFGSVFGGVIGGTGAGALPLVLKFIQGPDATTPTPTKQAGFIRLPLMFALFTAFFLMIPACASLQQAAKSHPIATACATSSAAIKTLTIAKQAGMLSAADQDALNTAVATLAPVCSAPSEPTVTDATLLAVDGAAASLSTAAAHYAAQ